MFPVSKWTGNVQHPQEGNESGLAFSSRHLITYRNKKGEDVKRIGKREQIGYAGDADPILPFLYSAAYRNGIERMAGL